jgi:acetylornithine/succinyldiaminopimelate/putrescine aminotransferase
MPFVANGLGLPRPCRSRGRLGKGILAKDTHEHTIRIAPPLVITSDEIDWALEQFATTLTQDLS